MILDVIEATIPEVRPELAPTAPIIDIRSRLMDTRLRLSGIRVEKPSTRLSLKQVLRFIDYVKEMSLSTLDLEMLFRAKEKLLGLVREAKVDEVYRVLKFRIEKFVAFVYLSLITDAPLFISEMAWTRVPIV